MPTATLSPAPEANVEGNADAGNCVQLADGTWLPLAGLSLAELSNLQWEQEQAFAQAIQAAPRQSDQREQVVSQAYDTVCTILAAQATDDKPFVMGFDPRYGQLVLELLYRQVKQGLGRPRFFEVGYGTGALMKTVAGEGFPIGGVEISAAMRNEALAALGTLHADELLLGDLRSFDLAAITEQPSLVYWNDVFEHICPDEIDDYLRHIYKMLLPGGTLVTITPNWLLRPSDVTCVFCPPRTEARGLHLREYRLAEVTHLLREAGFRRVATPLAVSHQRIYLAGGGLRWAKQQAEPLIDRLPLRWAHLLSRGLGLSYTIATK